MTRNRRIAARGAELLAEEWGHGPEWFYLSFADESGFLGGLIIKASGFVTALTFANLAGLNPGGEVKGFPIPYSDEDAAPWAMRLLTRDEATNLPEPGSRRE